MWYIHIEVAFVFLLLVKLSALAFVLQGGNCVVMPCDSCMSL